MREAPCHPGTKHYGKGLCLPCYRKVFTDPKYQVAWRKDNPGKSAEYTKRWRNKFPEKAHASERASRMKKEFGLSIAEYDTLLQRQSGVCKICAQPPKKIRLAVDHDHGLSKRIRGLLCAFCNYLVGQIETHPELLQKATAYLGLKR